MPVGDKIKKDIPLAPFTTFKIGGPARFFIEVKEKEELAEAIEWAKKNDEKIYFLGGGSNVLINDDGLPGLVIRLSNREVANLNPRFHCGAGASLAYTISLTRGAGLSGLEWGFGIPLATLGGCVRGNAGAFGMETGDYVETVEVYNIKKNKFEMFSHKECNFSYRSSIFKENPELIVWGVTLKLKPASAEEINSLIENNLKKRDTGQPKLPSAGSVFKNLFFDDILKVNPALAEFIKEQDATKGGKVGAGFLIDQRGLKGKTIGGAKISLEHANFIVNTGRATSKDVLDLINFIKEEIKLRFKVDLEEEIVIMK
jgi:UDP-N-acetylmuramate dehydrogenase